MKTKILDLIDFGKVDSLLEGFNKSTGFVTAILDLEGNVLSKSGWRQICTDFHRVNPESSKRCTQSDTVLAGKMEEGEKYHFYQCLNGLIDVSVPIVIKGEHIANLFSGQFFFEEPDVAFFKTQAKKYGFNEQVYLEALGKVPVVSKEKVLAAMDFLLNMTELISEMTFQKLEHQELNETILENERNLKLFVEHSPASIAMFDNQMRYLVVSHRFVTDYNLGAQNLIGRSHYDVFPEISESWKKIHQRGLSGETIKDEEDQFPRADGTTDWVRWEICPWYESDNQIGGIILFSEVITAQIEAREALQESEEKYRLLHEAAGVGIGYYTHEGVVISYNNMAAKNMNGDPEDFSGKSIFDFFPESEAEFYMGRIKKAALSETTQVYEDKVDLPGGNRWFNSFFTRIVDSNNEIAGIQIISTDITERKRIEENLRKSEERFANIFNVSPAAITITRKADGTYLNVNQSFLKIFEFSSEEVIGHTSSELNIIREEARKKIIKEQIGTNGVVNAELIAHTKTGREINLLFSSIPIWIDDEDCLVTTMIDITDRKLAEEDLKKAALLLQSSIESPKDMIILSIDKNYNYLYFNECHKAAMVYAYGKDVKIGMNLLDCITNEEDKIKAKINYDKALNGESHVTIQEYGDIEKSYYETRYNPVFNDKNEIIGTTAFSSDITHRKQAETELFQSEEKFKSSFHTNPTAQAILSQDGKFVESNEAFSKLIGYEKEQIIGNSAVDLGLLSFEEQKKLAAQAGATGGTVRNAEVIFTVRDGSLRYILYSVEPIILNGIPHRLSMGIDITESKLAEEALRISEQKYRNIFDNAPFGVFQSTPDGRFLSANSALANMLGYSSPDEMIRLVTNIAEQHYQEPPIRTKEIIAALGAGGFVSLEQPYRHLNGTTWIGRTHSRIVHDELGKTLFYEGFVEDITDRKKAEKALHESEERFRNAFEEAPMGIAMAGITDNRFIHVNHSLCEILGYTKEELLQLTFEDITYPEDRATDSETVKSLIEGEIHKHVTEKRYLRKNGEIIWGLRALTKISSSGDNPDYTLAMIKDITDRKVAEEQITQQLNELNRWYEAMINRENRVIELKQEVNELLIQHGEALRYISNVQDNPDSEKTGYF